MNEELVERFGRSKKGVKSERRIQAEVLILPPKLNPKIREYFEGKEVDGGSWLRRPEIPTSDEVMDSDTHSSASSDIVEIAPNKPEGAFEDVEEYLSTHYELLREDAVRPLREAVSKVRFTPQATEDAFGGQIGIYEKVHCCGVTLSTRGVAMRITFSLVRAGKQILWEQSKRLITGSLVVLTPADDLFSTKAIVAIVAARPLAGVQQNPPEIDLFFARHDEMEIDPAAEYVMIEERSAFFEANRHTLTALQHMMKEPFPLAEHLVEVKREVSSSKHVQENPKMDLTSVLINDKQSTYENVDVLKRWPAQPNSELDASQLKALRSILTKRLAIVQGPPGTGKTHVSVQAIKILLQNRQHDDSPILVACQTNHAVDQILRHIASFEPEFVRLGGRSKDRDIIKKRTLYNVRQETSENPPAGCLFGMAKKKMEDLKKEMTLLLTPLQPKKSPINHRTLEHFKILTKAQADSLEAGASKWVQDRKSNPNEARSPFLVWLGDKLVVVPPKQAPEEFGFDFEEADLEFEQLKEMEAENMTKDDEDFETLSGPHLPLADNYTCRKVPGMEGKAEEILKQQDMWKIPEASRGAIYLHLQVKLKQHMLAAFRDMSKRYDEQAAKRRIGYWEKDENILKRQKIIGCTTTGFSKYRPLISALQPKIILIEEAAETLESPCAVACVPSLQSLILVGDHQQLRPHTQVKQHQDKPYFLNVSLFERLVNNKVEFDMLQKQRRMIPEIRRLLYPIYKDQIKDHPSVTNPDNRPQVPGMGGVNSFFFTHQWSEQRDDQMSCLNPMEAEMIVGFVQHLAFNGVNIEEDITVLTFYNGQRKRILSELRHRFPDGRKFNVVTVDSYQGEENKIVILSLVRSNDKKQVGFLNVDNRVCVALSRAQCGFYIFGNGMLLHDSSKTWKSVIQIMAGMTNKKAIKADVPTFEPKRLDEVFPIRCSTHDRVVEIADPQDWDNLLGGCNLDCGGMLPCGHPCTLKCHPVPHEQVNCPRCRPPRNNGNDSGDDNGPTLQGPALLEPRPSSGSSQSKSTGSWQSFAKEEPARVQKHSESYQSRRNSPDKKKPGKINTVESTRQALAKTSMGFDGAADGPGSASSEATIKQWKDKLTVTSEAPTQEKEEQENLIDLA